MDPKKRDASHVWPVGTLVHSLLSPTLHRPYRYVNRNFRYSSSKSAEKLPSNSVVITLVVATVFLFTFGPVWSGVPFVQTDCTFTFVLWNCIYSDPGSYVHTPCRFRHVERTTDSFTRILSWPLPANRSLRTCYRRFVTNIFAWRRGYKWAAKCVLL